MKYLKTYKIFEAAQDFSWVSDLFQELNDDGFNVTVEQSYSRKLDFSKSDVVDVHVNPAGFRSEDSIKTVDVIVKRRIGDMRYFGIDRVKETLRFAESYAKDEGLEIEYLFVKSTGSDQYRPSPGRYLYYKSIDSLPDDQMVDCIILAFRKPEEILESDFIDLEQFRKMDPEIITSVKDILLPVTDDGIKVAVDYAAGDPNLILINANHHRPAVINGTGTSYRGFDINKYKDDIDMVISYLESKHMMLTNFNTGVLIENKVMVQNILRWSMANPRSSYLDYTLVKNPVVWISAEFKYGKIPF